MLAAAGSCSLEGGQHRPDTVDHVDGVGVGLALDGQDDGGRAVIPARRGGRLDQVDDAGDVAEPHRMAVATAASMRAMAAAYVGRQPRHGPTSTQPSRLPTVLARHA